MIYLESKYVSGIDGVSDRGRVDWLRTWEGLETVRSLVDSRLKDVRRQGLAWALHLSGRLAEIRKQKLRISQRRKRRKSNVNGVTGLKRDE